MKRLIFPLVFTILILPALVGIIHPGLFVSDDGGWMVIRFSAFYDALRHGQFPVRFLPQLNNGYGYPVADFLYPLFLYLGVPFKLMKFGFISTIKLIFGIGIITSGLFTYLWLRRIFGKTTSLCASLVYVFFPYHLWDVYGRGSIGEILAISILPFILWQIESKSWKRTAFGIGLLLISHNSLALLFVPLVICYLWIRKVFTRKYLLLIFFSGFGIVSFFWIPALYDKQFTVFDKTSVSDPVQYLNWQSSFNLLGIISLLAFVFILWHFYRRAHDTKLYLFSFILMIVFFLNTPISSNIWKFLPEKELIQFPFRLFSLAPAAVAYIVAKTIEQFNRKIFMIIITLIISFISCISFIFPKNYSFLPDAYYSTNLDTTTVHNEFMPIWVKIQNLKPKTKNEQIISGNGKIVSDITNGTNVNFDVGTTASGIQINFIYYPGWQVFVDGKQISIDYENKQGLIQFTSPPGRHAVSARFRETGFRLIWDIVSLISLIFIIFRIVIPARR